MVTDPGEICVAEGGYVLSLPDENTNDMGIFCYSSEGKSWSEAYNFCHQIGGKMPSIMNLDQNYEVASIINDVSYVCLHI